MLISSSCACSNGCRPTRRAGQFLPAAVPSLILPITLLCLVIAPGLSSAAGTASFEELLKLTASDFAKGDRFGEAVALSGGYAVVGAMRRDGPGLDAGGAYVFERDLGGLDAWGEASLLVASDASSGDLFGAAVAIDGETLAVGAPFGDSLSGTVYVFERGMGDWDEVVAIKAPDAGNGDEFGTSVGLSGDVLVVGSPLDSDDGFASGSAYVFERHQGGSDNWGLVTKITASDAAVSDFFGWSVAISDTTLAVGAERSSGNDAGAAYVFERDQGGADNWGEVEKLTASDAMGNDRFGFSVAVEGDHIVVGAYWNDAAGSNSGAAYLFQRDLGGSDAWGELSKLVASDGGTSDWLGASVDVSGPSVIAGAEFDDDQNSDAGAAYLFATDAIPGNSIEDLKLLASDGAAQDAFGGAVAIDGGMAIVGAREHDLPVAGAGAAYLFQRTPPMLAITGTCPGAVTVTVTGATADDLVGILRSNATGEWIVPGGPCQGIRLDLLNPRLLWTGLAAPDGTVTLNLTAPAAACASSLQAVDIGTCSTTDAATFP